jgi:hypothetical protein
MASVTERQALREILRQTHFHHLVPNKHKNYTRFQLQSKRYRREMPAYVRPRDLVPAWNIAPGDPVLVLAGGSEIARRVGTVAKVERTANRLYLRERQFMVRYACNRLDS